MKTKKIKIEVTQFENGDIILGKNDFGDFIVKNSDGIFHYNLNEMIEIYNYKGVK